MLISSHTSMYTLDHLFISSFSFTLEMLLGWIRNLECTVSPLINTAAFPVGATVDIASGLPHEAEDILGLPQLLTFLYQPLQNVHSQCFYGIQHQH